MSRAPVMPEVDRTKPRKMATAMPSIHMTWVKATSLPRAQEGAASETTASEVGRSAPAASPATRTPISSVMSSGASVMTIAPRAKQKMSQL